MPVLPWVGYPPKAWVRSRQWLGYTALWNLLDYSGLTFPVTRADPTIDHLSEDWVNHVVRNPSDKFNHEQCKLSLYIYIYDIHLLA
jgi:amidase